MQRLRDVLWKNKRTVTIASAFVIFLAVVLNVRADDFLRLDSTAYKVLVLHMRTPLLTKVMEGFSNLSSPVVIGGMVLMVAAFAPGRRPGLCAAVNLVCVVVINQVLKSIVQRPRPDGFRLISEVGYSFPSGHSMVSMAFYGLCAWMVWTYERDRIMRRLCCLAFAFVIVAIGISRVYLGVHYATDVIAGFCVSIAWIALYTKVFCPLFLPEETQRRAEEVANPIYVEPAHLYVADDTFAMKARHMRWTQKLPKEDDPS